MHLNMYIKLKLALRIKASMYEPHNCWMNGIIKSQIWHFVYPG